MALYAMGDFHLSSQNPAKQMNQFGSLWENHPQKIKENIERIVKPDDTIVITGDHSWAIKYENAKPDLQFIANLPGRKILIRGNHDFFWAKGMTKRLNNDFDGRLHFLQNNYFTYEDYALVGTKGLSYDEEIENYEKLYMRELGRLRISFEGAKTDGYDKFIMFLHYPPTSVNEEESEFTRIAEEYCACQVVYSHCHGEKHFGDSIIGERNGIRYSLVSADFLKFIPKKILG